MEATDFLHSKLTDRLKEFTIDEDLVRSKFVLTSNIRIYINYNNYDQYSYVILYSPDPMDRIIIDNYDELWEVKSKPNHIHSRYEKEGKETKFTGDPTKDMALLITLI